MDRSALLAVFKEYRADGYSPASALSNALSDSRIFKSGKSAASVAMHRATTRARLLTGMRDTWRLAYSVARIEQRAAQH